MSAKRSREAEDDDGASKRIRSNHGSPISATPATNLSTDADHAKQQIAARMAAMKAKIAAAKANASAATLTPAVGMSTTSAQAPVENGKADAEAQKAEAMRKIAEFKARTASQRAQTSSPASNGNSVQSDLQARIAEARAKAAELAKQRTMAPVATISTQPARQEGHSARGGLGIGLHPSLIGNQEPSTAKGKNQGPKFSTTRGNKAAEPVKINPYLPAEDEEAAREDSGSFDLSIGKRGADRKSKALAFAPQGKYIAQAAALKQQARLEDMKRRIALETKKIAIEEASDKSFIVSAPPAVEWWDEGLLPDDHKTYDEWEKYNKIESADSVITLYVQHPVLLAAPQDKFMPAPKPLMLTTKEQKKLRRQRRMADMKEEQAKIRLGLIEPPPPKVKKSNMMRVFGEQAVKDPTAVEARVNREIAQRAFDHERANQERKLTKEERAEKLKQQQAADEGKGIHIAVFKVDNLSSGKHRYQIDVNAKQNELTGIVVLHPDMNLVVVEGGVHSISAYKKLMLNRIKWSENTLPLSNNSSSTFTAAAARNVNRDLETGPNAIDTWLNPLTDRGELKDLSENQCLLVWEGDERQRAFRKWGSRVCETDGEARDTLARSKMENMWTLAKGTTA